MLLLEERIRVGKKVPFKLANIQRELPKVSISKPFTQVDLEANFKRVYEEARSIK